MSAPAKDSFVHLHNHSDYSLLDGAVKIDTMIARVKEQGMSALALTDHGNMFGAVEFYEAAKKAGIRPILGCEIYVARTSRKEKSTRREGANPIDHMILLARSEAGYRNLMRITSTGFLEGFHYKPRVDQEVLERHHEGLIATSACLNGVIPKMLLDGREEEALERAGRYQEIFGKGNFYLEIQDHGIPDERSAARKLVDLARRAGLPLVATNDCHYLNREDAEAHEILLCIQTGKTVNDPDRWRFDTDQIYLKSAGEMTALFTEVPEAIRATVEIAERCRLALDFGAIHLPHFPLPSGQENADAYLRHLAETGLRARYPTVTAEIRRRADFELQVICDMGYAGYFLVVRDFIQRARDTGIAVGPGRGSAAGSIVSYALGITDIDPLRFGLLFERFLNPERVSMPDIDIDFAYERRDEVIRYVKEKYGEESVTQIITFGTMAARAVVRDVGRALGLTYGEVDRIAKMIPGELGITLDRAIEQVPELKEMASSGAVHEKLLRIARTLEGLSRHASVHAAGVLIVPGRLEENVPLFKTNKDEVTTQYDMKSVEKVGLLKMDFLGLRTLTVLTDTVELLRRTRGVELDMKAVPLDDARTFDLLRNAQTVGVFQLESGGMRDLLRRLVPESFEDIIAVNALYRPGPMGSDMVTHYIEVKHGRRKLKYEHPMLEPILAPTYGVILYQEQVMQIASAMGGFSLGQADLLRRAMGKKDAKVMDAQKETFVKGAVERKIPAGAAGKVFDLMAYFAGYGFNKSHSAAYAILSYQTAYLKAHFPEEFLAATLTSEMESSARVVTLIDEARRMGIEVLPPDINTSGAKFTVEDGKIRFGLGAIKNVGHAAIESMVLARAADGPFRSLQDLAERVDGRLVNKRVFESLIVAGSLDALPGTRAQRFASVPLVIERVSKTKGAAAAQIDLFGGGAGGLNLGEAPLPDVPDWNRAEALAREKEVLGFYFSDHPLAAIREELAAMEIPTIAGVKGLPDGREVAFVGVVAGVKRITDRNQRQMAFVTVEDFQGEIECLCFADVFDGAKTFLSPDRVVYLKGRTSTKEEEEVKVILTEVLPWENARDRIVSSLHIYLPMEDTTAERLEELKGIVSAHPGRAALVLHFEREDGERVRMLGRGLTVQVRSELLKALRELIGENRVRIKNGGPGR